MNISKDLKTAIFQIYQCIFKPITFGEPIEYLDKKSNLKLILKLSFFSFIISVIVGLIGAIGFNFVKWPYTSTSNPFFYAIALFFTIGIVMGIAGGIVFGIVFGIKSAIAGNFSLDIVAVIAGGIAAGIALTVALVCFVNQELVEAGIAGGIMTGITFGIAAGIVMVGIAGRRGSFAGGIVFGIVLVFVLVLVLAMFSIFVSDIAPLLIELDGYSQYTMLFATLGIALLFSYLRGFYILPHMIQYFRVKFFEHEPFSLFRNSPIYWNEVILIPLPFLSNFLVTLTTTNRKEGLSEIEFVSSKRPTQRKAAFLALQEITIQDLRGFKSIEEIADASNKISFLSAFESFLSKELSDAVRKIDDISIDAKSYLESSSNYNKLRNVDALVNDVDNFKKMLIATKGPVGYNFFLIAEKWSQILDEEYNKIIERKQETVKEISNPYIFGNPVNPDDESRLFIGRLDIIRAIESNLANISQKPTLFLHGRRRVGKSSVLINLPRFLGKQYVSAYIDYQYPGTRESNASFCYTISKAMTKSLKDRGVSIEYPPLESFQKNPFTILGNWFDKIEKTLETENKLILLALDEYEKIEESILSGVLTTDILNQLRNIIQHRKHFVVLITGTKELNELKLNWADYLISAKTIKLGYLSKEDTRILITNPIDDFSLNYEGGENGEVVNKIIDVTSCQPYLVQALCFELVNYLNTQHRKEARMDDIDTAIEKVLISADTYFYYIWNTECSEKEKELLKRLVSNLPLKGDEEEINSLMRKEIIENINGNFRFKVELMKNWIEKNN